MRNTLFLLLLPFAGIAQSKVATTADCKPFLKVHFSTLKLNTGSTTDPKKADFNCLTVFDGDFLLTDTTPSEKIPVKHRHEKLACDDRAEHVAISYNYSPVLKGDVLEYDAARKKGVLKGHVTITKNGVDQPIGEYARVDLSDNRYMIEKLK